MPMNLILFAVFPFICAGQNFGRYSDYTISAGYVSTFGTSFPSKCKFKLAALYF
jgi:hypothetical protein